MTMFLSRLASFRQVHPRMVSLVSFVLLLAIPNFLLPERFGTIGTELLVLVYAFGFVGIPMGIKRTKHHKAHKAWDQAHPNPRGLTNASLQFYYLPKKQWYRIKIDFETRSIAYFSNKDKKGRDRFEYSMNWEHPGNFLDCAMQAMLAQFVEHGGIRYTGELVAVAVQIYSNIYVQAEDEDRIFSHEFSHNKWRRARLGQSSFDQDESDSKPPAGKVFQALRFFDLGSNASFSDCKQAWRQYCLQYHPDRLAGASAEQRQEGDVKIRMINAHFDVLRQHFEPV